MQAVQTAFRTTTAQQTAAFRIDEKSQAKGPGGSAENAAITGTGQVDMTSKTFEVRMSLPTGGGLTVLETGGIEYFQVPAAGRSRIPGHKAWLAVNLNKVSQTMLGQSFSQFASVGSDNPAQTLAQLAALSSGVSEVGSATVAGVPVTEYRAQVSLDKLANQAQATEGAKAAQLIRQKEKALGTSALPVQVWIDASHRVRQIREQVPIPAAATSGSTGGGTATLTITFTRFGVPVRLTPPPASQTADITSQVLHQATASSG